MAGQVVLVTGCSVGGVGAALAEEFAARGCRVYATARNASKMEGLSNVEKLELDVLSDDSVKAAVETIKAREGRIDILVNNAGVGCTGALLDLPMGTIDHAFQTNVFSILRLTQAVVPIMVTQKSKGTVVNVGSVSSLVPQPWGGTYCAAKSAVHTFSDVLDMELRPLGIKLVLLAPGSIKSNIGVNQTAAHVAAPADTLYTTHRANIHARLSISQNAESIPTDVFARKTVDALLKPNPPRFMSMAPRRRGWGIFILGWLPRSMRLNWTWDMYSKPIKTVDAMLKPESSRFMSIAFLRRGWTSFLLSWLPRATRLNLLTGTSNKTV